MFQLLVGTCGWHCCCLGDLPGFFSFTSTFSLVLSCFGGSFLLHLSAPACNGGTGPTTYKNKFFIVKWHINTRHIPYFLVEVGSALSTWDDSSSPVLWPLLRSHIWSFYSVLPRKSCVCTAPSYSFESWDSSAGLVLESLATTHRISMGSMIFVRRICVRDIFLYKRIITL